MLLTFPRRQIRSRRRRPTRSSIQSPAELIEPRLCLSATSAAACLDEFEFGFDEQDYESEESLAWADDSDWIEFEWIVDSTWEEDWSLEEVEIWDEFSEWDVITWEFDSFSDEFAWLEDEWDTEWTSDGWLESDDVWEADDLILVEYVDTLTDWLYDDWWGEDYQEIPFGDDALMPDAFGDDALLPDEDLAVFEEAIFEEYVVFETAEFIDFETTEFDDESDFDFESDDFEVVIIVETFEEFIDWNGDEAEVVSEDEFAAEGFDEAGDFEFDESLIETVVVVDGEIVFGGEVPPDFDFDPVEFEPAEFTPDDFAGGEFGDVDFDTDPIESSETESVRPVVEAQSRPIDSSTLQQVAGLGIDEGGRREVTISARDSKVTTQLHRHRSQRDGLRETNLDAARSRSRFAAKLATNHFPITSRDQSAGHDGSAGQPQQFTPRELAVRQFREARARIQSGRPVNSEALRAAVMSEAAMETSGPGSVAGWNDAVWSSERLTMALSELPDPQIDDTSDEGDVTCAQVVSAAGAAAIAGSFGFQFAERRGFDLLRRLAAIILRRA